MQWNHGQHLTSVTGGRRSYNMEYSHYEEVPQQQAKTVAAAKAERAGGRNCQLHPPVNAALLLETEAAPTSRNKGTVRVTRSPHRRSAQSRNPSTALCRATNSAMTVPWETATRLADSQRSISACMAA
jgi:hypothetical protein